MYIAGDFDIAVIGGGHAGCEAALASSRLGMKTVLFAMNLDTIANMPCNPNIGGTSKGHLVKEIDSLGGEMGKNIDKTFIQSRMLNKSKGPAVHSLRAQADRRKYSEEMKHTLEKEKNLSVKQAEIIDIVVKNRSSHICCNKKSGNLSDKICYYSNRNIFKRKNIYWRTVL